MRHRASLLFLSLLVIIGMIRCEKKQKSEYVQLVEKELSKNERQDSIYFGIYFGMSKKEFFDHCWELNRKGILSSGTSSLSVIYKLDTGLKYQAEMNFVPGMLNDTIYEMSTIFNYSAFSPTNKSLSSDSLIIDVQRMLERWYGEGFITIEDEKKGKAKIKIDRNRRIGLYKADDYYVIALFTDLLKKKEMLKAEKDSSAINIPATQ